ncbi:NADP-dependent isocitrate dehydrogenase [Campylobacter mucosalis]|uniref:NADP-dependent isocitrate dehydrogenase n=1 Tax=Campylobacter mucosalis TaxID=202 RepID=UPI0014707C3D|nr:NADP-dependent isocitrate dehydrogenase [Campylobacter mucosalis]
MSQIIWTKTDEAPFVSSVSFLPILKCFLSRAGINLKEIDISLASRVLAQFNKCEDGLLELSKIVKQSDANIIKLPNISASLPQLNSLIDELNSLGYDLPKYADEPQNEEERANKQKYQKVLGSAVNPVLREGNSDRRSVKAVKDYARQNPHYMGEWDEKNRCEVAYMNGGDFYANEHSNVIKKDEILRIDFIHKDGKKEILKDDIAVKMGDIIDASYMSVDSLDEFFHEQIDDTKSKNLLFSLHLKATMMKVSDPVIFGRALRVFFKDVFDEFEADLKSAGVNANSGLKELFAKIENLPNKDKILAKFQEVYTSRPDVAMVDLKQGVDNFGVPSDVIIDASVPALLRNSGKMSDKNGALRECKIIIPDSTYARVYEAVVEDFKANKKLDVATLGSVSNIGLMAKKAQEYGSSDKTFIAGTDGEFVISGREEIFRFSVKKGDIFRAMTTSIEAIQSWILLAIKRAKDSGEPLIFWLDKDREHDNNLIKIIQNFNDLNDVCYEILNYQDACKKSLQMIREGKNVISVTGNVLRDYLTDLFPILELGTSSKMLSIVPLLCGGAIFETGAGGTAPRLAMGLRDENHLGWDSLGEFLALIASLEFEGSKNAKILSKALDNAVARYLKDDRSPKMQVGEADTRLSHYYIALYWASELKDSGIDGFNELYKKLLENEEIIKAELSQNKGKQADLGGWYYLNENTINSLMRPSKTLNQIIG